MLSKLKAIYDNEVRFVAYISKIRSRDLRILIIKFIDRMSL